MRRAWITSALLLFSAIPISAAGPKSNIAAVNLVARVVPVLLLQADSISATGATATVSDSSQNAFTLQFSMNDSETALIQVPILIRTNTNDVLLKASMDGAMSGYIRMEGGEAIASSISSRPMPLGPNVTFAVASGLLRTSGVRAPLAGMITIAIPPGAVPDGRRASVKVTLESLRQ